MDTCVYHTSHFMTGVPQVLAESKGLTIHMLKPSGAPLGMEQHLLPLNVWACGLQGMSGSTL